MAQRYKVSGAYITCKTLTNDGPMIIGLYKDAWVPEDATGEWIEHHLKNDLIVPIAGTGPAVAASAPEPPKPVVKPQAAAAKGGA